MGIKKSETGIHSYNAYNHNYVLKSETEKGIYSIIIYIVIKSVIEMIDAVTKCLYELARSKKNALIPCFLIMNQFCRILQYVDLFLRAASADVAPHVARLLRVNFSGDHPYH